MNKEELENRLKIYKERKKQLEVKIKEIKEELDIMKGKKVDEENSDYDEVFDKED